MPASDVMEALEARAGEIASACTRCGKCFEVCPMTAPAGIEDADPKAVVEGVLDILAAGEGPAAAERWAGVCSNSGSCIPACDDGVDPRFMLILARLAMRQRTDGAARRRAGVENFKDMTRAVHILPRLQLSPDQLARVAPARVAPDNVSPGGPAPEIIFYTGCNILRTPHIALLCLDVLDAIGVRYAIHGGPGECCGILQFRPGDAENAGRQAFKTIERFTQTGAAEVVSWCPTCQIQIGETMQPLFEETVGEAGFDMTMMPVFLARRLDRLKPLFRHRVERRVGLHEHPGSPGVSEAVEALLRAIPGLEFVELAQPRVGYMCNSLAQVPDYRRELHEAQLQAAAAAGVDTLAGVFHACHRDLCSHERDWPFEVVNFMELVGEAMGFERPDIFKRLKMLQDVDLILEESRDMINHYDLDISTVREVVLKNMLGEQTLPLKSDPRE